jgi:hypothetical protein
MTLQARVDDWQSKAMIKLYTTFKPYRACLAAAAALAISASLAIAQSPKELKVESGKSVILVNLVNPRPDCSSNPGPFALPVLREKPANGVVQILTLVANVPATETCPSRKIPSIALIYTARKDFTGADSAEIEVEEGNKTTTFSFRITVQAAAEQL